MVLAADDVRSSATGSVYTDAQYICGLATGNSGRVGGNPAYFDAF